MRKLVLGTPSINRCDAPTRSWVADVLPEARRTAATGARAAARARKFVVLVVDDNRDSADSQGLLVRCWGHDARVAYNGAEALAAARIEPPDAVLMDIAMPSMNGFEVARLLRHQCPGRDMLFVALTGYAEAVLELRWQDEDFNDFLLKPADPTLVKHLLAWHRAMRTAPEWCNRTGAAT